MFFKQKLCRTVLVLNHQGELEKDTGLVERKTSKYLITNDFFYSKLQFGNNDILDKLYALSANDITYSSIAIYIVANAIDMSKLSRSKVQAYFVINGTWLTHGQLVVDKFTIEQKNNTNTKTISAEFHADIAKIKSMFAYNSIELSLKNIPLVNVFAIKDLTESDNKYVNNILCESLVGWINANCETVKPN